MTPDGRNSLLNQLLINLCRSLLQYAGEAWPWIRLEDTWEREKVEELVARQQRGIGRLAELLAERDWPVDFGSYPTEYSDLNYIALDYLIEQLIANEEALIADLEETIRTCAEDPEAVQLLNEILDEQRQIVAALKQLRQERSTGAAA